MVTAPRKESLAPRLDKDARREKMLLPPQPVQSRSVAHRLTDFAEVLLPFTEAEAMAEAARCISCPGAPCVNACLLNNDIPGAMWLISQGDFLGAARLYQETSAMPEICGRICPQENLCEGACVLGKKGTPLALGRLEAFAIDYAAARDPYLPVSLPSTGRHVGIIGSGPAGLTAADWLRRHGHAVTVYEAYPEPGGLLTYGIPNFKLEKETVRERVDALQLRGVKFICNTLIGTDIPFDDLRTQFDAVFVATGANIDATAEIDGIDLPGITVATPFLVRANLPLESWPAAIAADVSPVGRKITVFGGGDTAMDCVRTALRLQAQSSYPLDVTCVYRRTEDEMPGSAKERHHAYEEWAKFEYLTAPVRFIPDEYGRVGAVECARMTLSDDLDRTGRRRPEPIPDSEFVIVTDQVVLALGYWPDPLLGEHVPELETHKWGLIIIDEETGETSLPGVYAGGDNVNGPDLVGTAVAAGIRSAYAIDAYLMGERSAA